jgi:citrate lyase beta subunit
MIDTYFFIPGDKPNFLSKMSEINADFFIVDLEDAVSVQNKKEAFDLALLLIPEEHHFVRIPFFENCYSERQLIKMIKHFGGRIVIPKLTQIMELTQIMSFAPDVSLEIILLVENPICFINLLEVLKSFSSQIHAIGFGSHDFCSITGIKHTLEHLEHYKKQLILYAKAFNVDYIDGVDLDLSDFSQFKKECVFAFEIGANGKFLIHPKQIEELKNVSYLSDVDLERLKVVYNKIKDIPEDSIEVYTIDGKVYEKPHIMRIKYLMKKLQNSRKK